MTESGRECVIENLGGENGQVLAGVTQPRRKVKAKRTLHGQVAKDKQTHQTRKDENPTLLLSGEGLEKKKWRTIRLAQAARATRKGRLLV